MENPRISHPRIRPLWHRFASLFIGILLLLPGLTGCAKAADTPPVPTLSFTISWDDPKHANLKTAGGYTVEQGVLIAHVKDGSYIAVSANCTFEGTKLAYRLSSDQIYCATDGSAFDIHGKPVNGPATKPLTVYTIVSSKSTAGLFTITN